MISDLKKIQQLAVVAWDTAVNPETDGGYGEYEEFLEDLVGWTGTNSLGKLRMIEDDALEGVEGSLGEGGMIQPS